MATVGHHARVRRLPCLARSGFALVVLAVLGGVGCVPAPQPAECRALLACIYERDDQDEIPEGHFGEDEALYEEDNQAAIQNAFGPGGECWQNGPLDPYYDACVARCRGHLSADCAADTQYCTADLEAEGLTCDAVVGG